MPLGLQIGMGLGGYACANVRGESEENGNGGAPSYMYVRTTGSDTTGDGTEANPLRTLQKAVNLLSLPTHFDLSEAAEFAGAIFDMWPNTPRPGNVVITVRGIAGTEIMSLVFPAEETEVFDVTLMGPILVAQINANPIPINLTRNGGELRIRAGINTVVGSALCSGDPFTPGGGDGPPFDGGNGGTINLFGPFTITGEINVTSGPAGLNDAMMQGFPGTEGTWQTHDGTLTPYYT